MHRPRTAALPARTSHSAASLLAAMALTLAAPPAHAAAVMLGGSHFDSGSAYAISRSGVDANGQQASASADELGGQVAGRLVGPNWPPFLTAGFTVGAESTTGHPLGTHYRVEGVAPGTALTFVWEIAGSYAGQADAQAFRIEAAWGLYNGRNLLLGGFDGLSFIDTTAAAGDFAGRREGSFHCAANANSRHDLCGSNWDAQGSRRVWVHDDQPEGWLAAEIRIAGSGADTRADYRITLVEVQADASALFGLGRASAGAGLAALGDEVGRNAAGRAQLRFDSGRTLAITPVGGPNTPLPEPATAVLLALAGGLAALARRPARRR